MFDNGEIIGGNGEAKETVNLEDIILCVRRGENGKFETMIAPANRQELEIALMRITHQAYGIFNAMSYADQKAKESKIVKANGIMDFVRRKK